jgi:phospholipase C
VRCVLARSDLEGDQDVANQLQAIKNIVVLMMENRSFDQMLGFLYAPGDKKKATDGGFFDGLTGNESNPDDTGQEIKVYKIGPSSPHPYLMPGADPGEGFHNTNYQLFQTDDPEPGQVPANKGFVINFKSAIASDQAKHYKDSLPNTDPSEIMGMYGPDMLPVMSALAKGYAVCDRWFAAAPTQTIPNRAFVGAATSQGHLDNAVKIFTSPSIFGALEKAGIDWAIYGYNSDPLTRHDFSDIQQAEESHFGHYRDFQDRAKAGTLPAYSFVEPSWSASGNSQHPNYDVALGEQLMAQIYDTLRTSPAWDETLLIITYDEHGGNYDHVPPPWGAVPPDNSVGEWNFGFDRFGVRVPALLISPLIAQGTVFRSTQGTIDHTSILKTVELRFGLQPLTKRDAAAPDIGDVLTLAKPRTDNVLKGVTTPKSSGAHPNSSQPSVIEKMHASKVSKLPLRNDQGSYDQHAPPNLSTSAEINEYIQGRTAAWSQHLQRMRTRKTAKGGDVAASTATAPATAAKGTRKAKAPAVKGKAKKKKK